MIVIIFIFFLVENILERYIPLLNYTDEIVAILATLGLLFKGKIIRINKYEKKIFLCIFAVICIGVIGNIRYKYQDSLLGIAKDIVAIAKFFVVYLFCSVRLKKGISKTTIRKIETICKVYCLILLFFGVLSQFINLGMTNGRVLGRFKAFVFLYSHETFLVSTVVIMMSVLMSCGIKNNKIFLIAGAGILFFSMRSKSIVFVIIALGMYIFINGRGSVEGFWKKHKAQIVLVLCGASIVVLGLTYNKIQTYVQFGMTAARPALYIVAIKIMTDLFPFGSGFSTFASHLSVSYNSPLYRVYGISNISGLSQWDNYAYVSDTYWPYIIAQLGVLGTAFYLYAVLCVFKNTIDKCSLNRDMLIAAVSLFAYAFAACFVESYLTNSTIILFSITLGYILNSKKNVVYDDKNKGRLSPLSS